MKSKGKYKNHTGVENELEYTNSTNTSSIDINRKHKFLLENRKLSNINNLKQNSFKYKKINSNKVLIKNNKSNNYSLNKDKILFKDIKKICEVIIKLKHLIGNIIHEIIVIICNLFLIMTIMIFILMFLVSIFNMDNYQDYSIITNNKFFELLNKFKISNYIKNGEIIESVNNNKSSDFNEIEMKFEEMERNIIGLNKKIGFLVEIMEEIKNVNLNKIESKIEEIIFKKTNSIKDEMNIINNNFILKKDHLYEQLLKIKQNNLKYFKYCNESIIKLRNDSKNKKINEKINYINKKVNLIINNITEIEKINQILRKEFDNLSEEVKLIDEAQDVLRSMLWSINKRNEDKLMLNFNTKDNHEINNKIQLYISKLFQIKNEMQGYEAIDWAQSSMGGKVIYPKTNKFCSKKYSDKEKSLIIKFLIYLQKKLFWFINKKYESSLSIPIYNVDCFEPNQLVKSDQIKSIGNCLLLPVGSIIIIELSININITAIGIDHILFPLEYDKGYTVPRNISLECIQSTFEKRNINYFIYNYPQNNESLQIYSINKGIVCKQVKFKIISTYGSKYACLYKLRVYGEPFDKDLTLNYKSKFIQIEFIINIFELITKYTKYLIYNVSKIFQNIFKTINNQYQKNKKYKFKKIDHLNYEKKYIHQVDDDYINQQNYSNKNNSLIKNIHIKKRERDFK